MRYTRRARGFLNGVLCGRRKLRSTQEARKTRHGNGRVGDEIIEKKQFDAVWTLGLGLSPRSTASHAATIEACRHMLPAMFQLKILCFERVAQDSIHIMTLWQH
jgi:hypothetical protein